MFNRALTRDITQLLAARPEYNALLLNVIERNCHEDVRIIGNSVRIRDRTSGVYMFSGPARDELESLLDERNGELDTFFINDSSVMEAVLRKYPGATAVEYQSYVLQRKDYIPNQETREGVELTTLDLSWLDFILEHYRDEEFGHEHYISDRILHGPGIGLLYWGQKAAFGLQHKDGETGPIVVDAKWRDMGLGTYVVCALNRLLFKRNSMLICFVKPGNLASAHMMMNSGYQATGNNVLWVYRKLNNTLYLP